MTPLSPFWITTSEAIAFDYNDPRPEMISERDLIHHLSRESRWANNIEFASFTVAQHSMVVAAACKLPQSRPYALLHDGAEVYTRDLPTPFKLWLADQGADIVGLEHRIFAAILIRLGLPMPSPDITADVHQADQRALATEHRDVVKGRRPDWTPKAPPLSSKIRFKPQPKIEEEFTYALASALQPYRKAA